jgi:hypothetical protein
VWLRLGLPILLLVGLLLGLLAWYTELPWFLARPWYAQ